MWQRVLWSDETKVEYILLCHTEVEGVYWRSFLSADVIILTAVKTLWCAREIQTFI